MIARIEREAPQSGEVWVQPKVSQPGEVSGRRARVPRRRSFALLALLLVGAVVAFGLLRRREATMATSPAAGLTVKEGAAGVERPSPVVHEWKEPDAPSPTAEPAPPIVDETSARAARSTRSESTASKRRAGKAAKATDAKPDCDPPYVVDAQGHKKFRVECL
jgi:serine/threonine-protein kinase